MKYLILLLLSFNVFALSGYSQFRYRDRVELLIGGSQDHWFYNCPKKGNIISYVDKGLNGCLFKYVVEFECSVWEIKRYVNKMVKTTYCGKSLKKVYNKNE